MIDRLSAALSDRYRVERELRKGGMATVYLAEDLKHRRNVAVKVLRPELAAVVGAERFLAEIETTAGLQHPHILPLFDSGESNDPDVPKSREDGRKQSVGLKAFAAWQLAQSFDDGRKVVPNQLRGENTIGAGPGPEDLAENLLNRLVWANLFLPIGSELREEVLAWQSGHPGALQCLTEKGTPAALDTANGVGSSHPGVSHRHASAQSNGLGVNLRDPHAL